MQLFFLHISLKHWSLSTILLSFASRRLWSAYMLNSSLMTPRNGSLILSQDGLFVSLTNNNVYSYSSSRPPCRHNSRYSLASLSPVYVSRPPKSTSPPWITHQTHCPLSSGRLHSHAAPFFWGGDLVSLRWTSILKVGCHEPCGKPCCQGEQRHITLPPPRGYSTRVAPRYSASLSRWTTINFVLKWRWIQYMTSLIRTSRTLREAMLPGATASYYNLYKYNLIILLHISAALMPSSGCSTPRFKTCWNIINYKSNSCYITVIVQLM